MRNCWVVDVTLERIELQQQKLRKVFNVEGRTREKAHK